jgi:hypothetical protein
VTGAAARCAALRYRGRYVNPGSMGPGARQVLARAQAAISDILTAQVVSEGHLDGLAAAAVLDAREWEVARLLSEACRLAAASASILHGAAAPPARPQAEILRQVRAAAVRQVRDIEECSRQVRAADAARRAHAAAEPLAGLDDSFLDLLAMTASDHARREMRSLRAEAAAVEQAFTAS